MTSETVPPFSARSRRERAWVEDDFPESARNGLLHLLHDAVERSYISGWTVIAKELGRMVRATPWEYNSRSVPSIEIAQRNAGVFLNQLQWDRVFDFCERVYSYLADETSYESSNETVIITKAQSQQFIAGEMQRLFEEENLAYEFKEGLVQRRGKRHTIDQINKAGTALADPRLNAARRHFSKALRLYREREKPDYENAVKEAVCAVEAAAKELFPESKAATLGDFVKWATSGEHSLLHKTIGQTITGLYAFRNSGEGVSHGATSGGVVTSELSEYVLGIAASQIVFLIDLARDDEPPF